MAGETLSAPLLSREDDDNDLRKEQDETEEKHWESSDFHSTRPKGLDVKRIATSLSFVFVLFCSILNATIVFTRGSTPREVPIDLSSLPRIHSYVGLDNLRDFMNETYESELKVLTFPRVLTQVSSVEPQRIWPDDPLQSRDKDLGNLSPDSRRVHIGEEVHSIVQFRVVDFGMEYCYLSLDLTALNKTATSYSSPDESSISLWRLEEYPESIDVTKLSWLTRPSRKQQFASWKINEVTNSFTTGYFPCPWGTYPAFEIGCEGRGCQIDFWNNPRVKQPALTLVQTTSLLPV